LPCDRDEEEETAVKTKTLLKMSAAVIAIPVAFTITAGTAAAGCKSGYDPAAVHMDRTPAVMGMCGAKRSPGTSFV